MRNVLFHFCQLWAVNVQTIGRIRSVSTHELKLICHALVLLRTVKYQYIVAFQMGLWIQANCLYISEGVLSPKLYVDVHAEPRKFAFLYTNFSYKYLARGCSEELHYDWPAISPPLLLRREGWQTKWSYINELTNTHPSVGPIPFSNEKLPILLKLSAFYYNLLKIHPICHLGSYISDNHWSLYQISRNGTPKGRHILGIPC